MTMKVSYVSFLILHLRNSKTKKNENKHETTKKKKTNIHTNTVDIEEEDDGIYVCTPFHVRFGKVQVLRSHDVHVSIEINDKPVDLAMKLGAAGEAFFAVPTKVCLCLYLCLISFYIILYHLPF